MGVLLFDKLHHTYCILTDNIILYLKRYPLTDKEEDPVKI